MSRQTWIYPADGSPPYPAGTRGHDGPGGVVFLPDLPDFVSPIDGKRYNGRAGLREHCKIHDVVPNADLKGLPTLTTGSDQRSLEQRKADESYRKRLIINEVNTQYRKYNS